MSKNHPKVLFTLNVFYFRSVLLHLHLLEIKYDEKHPYYKIITIPVFVLLLYRIYKRSNPSYFFQQLNLDKGLSQTTVNCILADNKGLIWIGTASGLSCFDRYGMKSYFHEKDNPYSLPGNTIYFIAEDSLNNIWVSTNNGLTLYDKSSDSFRPVKFEDKIIITNSFHTFSGSILFTADEGVYIYDGKSRTLHKRPVLQKRLIRFYTLLYSSLGQRRSIAYLTQKRYPQIQPGYRSDNSYRLSDPNGRPECGLSG